MTLEFRDHQILVISPGSLVTQVQMGLKESLMPPAFEIPTVVFHDAASGALSVSPADGRDEVRPVVQGRIADEAAFLYLIKMIYTSVQPVDGLPPALYLVASLSWTRRQLERITHFCFEELRLPALSISLQGTSTSYAFATADCLIVDVGYAKTEIAVVSGFEESKTASRIVPLGSNDVNVELQRLLPALSATQIEDLKRSPIYEVLTKDQTKSQAVLQQSGINTTRQEEEEDGVVDIAAILSSGRTREILDERERQKHGEAQDPPNVAKKENQFVDRDGNTVTVGKERFEGCERLLSAIVDALADVLYSLPLREQEHLFDNVVICGRGSLIAGFRAELAERMQERYVVKAAGAGNGNSGTSGIGNDAAAAASAAAGNAAGNAAGPADEADAHQQGPTRLSLVRLPDHFPEWKNRKWEDVTFLGAQVGSKQVFTAGMEGIFVSRSDYNDAGPSSIWDAYN